MTLNELITFYSKGTTQDEYGTIVDTRTKIADAYSLVRPISGSERNQGDQTAGVANYRFHVLRRSDLATANVIVWNGVDYNIRFIADVPKSRYTFIDAERGVAQ
jgi:head-tail adaptor